MKKFLAIALVAGSLISGVFGQESSTGMLDNVSLILPTRTASATSNGIGVDWHGYKFNGGSLGIVTQCSFQVPMAVFDNEYGIFAFNLDGSIGATFSVLNTDMFALFISAGGTINMYDVMDAIYEFDFGVFAEASFSYKLFGDMYLTGGVQFNYYLYSYAIWPGVGSGGASDGVYEIVPRIGVTFFD